MNVLAGDIGERNLFRPDAFEASAEYVADQLRQSGVEVTTQTFDVDGQDARNIEAYIPGSGSPGETIIVGAHYDSVSGSAGADDNASGVAALIEIARALSSVQLRRNVRLVAFANEEPPYYRSRFMGSLVYARAARRRREQILGMISLETIGYYSKSPGSQEYPFPFGAFYPDTGDFIGFVGNLRSWTLARRCVEAFRRHSDFPSQWVAAPGWMVGVGWSDHWAFWKEGYPAVMVTDTAFFRYQHYHAWSDTPDKLDYDSTGRVVSGLQHVVQDLAGAQ